MKKTLACAWLAALAPAALSAQAAGGGPLVQSYTMTRSQDVRLRSVTLLALPFAARYPLGPDATASISGAYADARATLDNGEDAHDGGLIDTRLSLQAQRGPFLFGASALVPTGEVIQNTEDATLVGLLSTDLLPFAVTQWGAGGGIDGNVGYLFHGRRTTTRVEVGGSWRLDSSPFGSSLTYRPGWQARGRAAIESSIGQAGVLSILLGYQYFAVDAFGGRNLFRPGGRIEGLVSYAFAVGPRESALAYGGAYHLDGGTTEVEPAVLERIGIPFSGLGDQSSRLLLKVGGEMRLVRGRYDLVPTGEVRVLRRADGIGQGWLTSVGSRAEIHLQGGSYGRRLVVEPNVAVRFGHVVAAQDLASAVLGWQAGVTLRWEGGR